mmetsp:Transcript_83328/g.258770  ORF Transcript_83328/g.258770 Transcript_83328/m.258770 type:complete len:221 (-) Transcript_83328:365-1027(-)
MDAPPPPPGPGFRRSDGDELPSARLSPTSRSCRSVRLSSAANRRRRSWRRRTSSCAGPSRSSSGPCDQAPWLEGLVLGRGDARPLMRAGMSCVSKSAGRLLAGRTLSHEEAGRGPWPPISGVFAEERAGDSTSTSSALEGICHAERGWWGCPPSSALASLAHPVPAPVATGGRRLTAEGLGREGVGEGEAGVGDRPCSTCRLSSCWALDNVIGWFQIFWT